MCMVVAKACLPFPGIEEVRVCVVGDVVTGDPVVIEYKIHGFNDQECGSCDGNRSARGLADHSMRAMEAIRALFNGGETPSISVLGERALEKCSQSSFARRVVAALVTTRPGETVTYAELASRSGSPGAARAVGNVMRRNPFPIIVPCHRVVSSQGLGGYYGDVRGVSIAIKQKLLDIEAKSKVREPR